MEYNTQRQKLKIPDYGRIVANLINYAKTLDTKESRNAAAETIVRVMAQVNPDVKQTDNYQRSLWEHLMILSNWELDVDCPFPLEVTEEVSFQPRKLDYATSRIRYRHYGHCMEEMIKKVAAMPDDEDKELLTAMLIAQMKKSYLVWNRSGVDPSKINDYNDVVLRQLDELSQGKLREGDLKLDINPFMTRPAETAKKFKNKKKKRR